MILDYLVLYTADPPGLARFYVAALGLTERLRRFEDQYIELEAGGLTLAICGFDLRDKTLPEAARPSEGQALRSGAPHEPQSAGPNGQAILQVDRRASPLRILSSSVFAATT